MVKHIPPIAISLFVVLYVWSAALYPGGSFADYHHPGFDWINNYWCHLMDDRAINGKANPAQPWSITALAILLIGLAAFFLRFARIMPGRLHWKVVIRTGVFLVCVCAMLLSTGYHDLMTTLGSIFGAIALAGVIAILWSSHLRLYKWWGILCILLLGLNNYIYYTHQGLDALPFIQKCTFVVVLAWIWSVNTSLNRIERRTNFGAI